MGSPFEKLSYGSLFLFSGLRFAQLGAPIVGDAYGNLKYVSQGIAYTRTTYDSTQNHVFYNIVLGFLERLSPLGVADSVRGPALFQLFSIACSIAALFLLFRFVKRLAGSQAAFFSAVLLGLSYWHLLYSHMLRSYAFSTALLLLAAQALHEILDGKRGWVLWSFPLLVAALAYTHPFNFVYLLAFLAWGLGTLLLKKTAAKKNAALRCLALFAAGILLAFGAYAPILEELLSGGDISGLREPFSSVLLKTPERLAQWLAILGRHPLWRTLWLLLAAFGMLRLWRKKRRSLLLLLALWTGFPWLALNVLRYDVLTRLFIPSLPAWAFLGGLGLAEICSRLRHRQPIRFSRTAAAAVGLGVLLTGSLPDLSAFWSWTRDWRVRPALREIVKQVFEKDDFDVIVPEAPKDAFTALTISWQYPGYSTNLRPFETLNQEYVARYRVRRRLYLVADSKEKAEGMLSRSGVPRELFGKLELEKDFGSFSLYALDREEAIKAFFESPPKEYDQKKLADLFAERGVFALKEGDLRGAERWLEHSKRLNPEDAKSRYWLARTLFLSGRDRRAAEEFLWVSRTDEENVHARLYLAQALTNLGKTRESTLAFGYFLARPKRWRESAWYLLENALISFKALQVRGRPELFPVKTAEDAARLSKLLSDFGQYERAAFLTRLSLRAREDPAVRYERVRLLHFLRRFDEAVRNLRKLLERHSLFDFKMDLAETLRKKYRHDEAVGVLKQVALEHPGQTAHFKYVTLRKALRRAADP